MIEVSHISKNFKIQKRRSGAGGFVKDIFSREYMTKEAVKDVSFSIEDGECVGYIGPNGAGKSTTIKMLSGILVPSAGKVVVNGIEPYKNRKANALQVGLVFGQRTQLWWDIPVRDTLELYRKLYNIPEQTYKRNLEIFNDILELDKFDNVAVRQLSLGQRMRADLACALVYNPAVLYLDEPTIGLDVVVKEKIREFIKEVNREHQTTIMLTTHDMSDVEKLCKRVIVIDHGQVMFDGELDQLKHKYGEERIVNIEFSKPISEVEIPAEFAPFVVEKERNRLTLNTDTSKVKPINIVDYFRREVEIVDFEVREPEIEAVIRRMYQNMEA